ncbi:5'-methylthioadenosine/S-adenosylhomocysteine nucleosidase [Azospirillum sp. BE72]|uniref:5'-methylthioadenosine/S-adenosylhomocysteine nucleosidase family protein n=1 Tax=Azospirillum sp. BE72 TaxID=2817776 RepID=UPI0028637DA8|nr:5'-methylthioadenosine/S-adenosylhomocysteine nucleosidase [Azospirillum sp. BE72]MDR6772675.1 nucleoside phosphorylase [Azospirillum sp. BE72]
MRTAIIMTAIPVETSHVLQHLQGLRREMRRGSLFHIGQFSGQTGNWNVVVGEMGAGNAMAALLTERTIAEFKPDIALFVGIAGGMKDVRIGDVVVASSVYGYESGKIESTRFLVRPRELRSSTSLMSLARGLPYRNDWVARLRYRLPGDNRKLVFGRVAAGEKLVASAKSELCRFLREHYNDAIAVEMEGYGFLDAVNHNEEVRGLVVRGISDLLDDKAATDARGSQDIAADSAAAVAFEILSMLPDPMMGTMLVGSGPGPEGVVLSATVSAHTGASASFSVQDGAAKETPLAPFCTIPQREWLPDRSPPGALLRADYGVVPFHGRELEQLDLVKWCEEDTSAVAVRLYTGAGGMGKTRLFIELCHRMRKDGWRVGFVDPDQAPGRPDGWTGNLPDGSGDRMFIVVDYAETRPEIVESLLARASGQEAGRLRIILLARAIGDWWELMKARSRGVGDLLSGPATRWHQLRPLTLSDDERRHSYHLARQEFAGKLHRPEPQDDEFDIGLTLFDRVLLLHMRALASIEGIRVQGEDGVLNYVLQQEKHYWEERARARGLPPTLLDGISQAMAVLTLGGGARTADEARAILAKVPLLADQPQHILNEVSKLLRDAYPGERWIEPLLPDLLGEHLVEAELDRNADALFDLVFGTRDLP